jgi:phosphopentomutase
MINRVILIVLDSAGIGALPDADKYGDTGSNTLVHTAQMMDGLSLPNMGELGLGNVDKIPGVPEVTEDDVVGPIGFYGKMAEKSAGKDTTTGHWEMTGIVLDKPFTVFHDGFPDELIDEFKEKIGSDVLGNYAASGTEIIKVLGDEHVETKKPIVYTSADSVFQIAAHQEVIPLERLYEICEIARVICDKYAIGRVIARPFLGEPGNYYRTPNRRDFSIIPPKRTILDMLKDAGENVVGIGKIEDIFANRGLTHSIHTKSNDEGMERMTDAIGDFKTGLIFTNLVEFDMLYGHRNDYKGYANALEEFDAWLGGILPTLSESDLLIITADHGCDPTTKSTDHSREYVPLLAYSKSNTRGRSLGTRASFSDIAKTIAEVFKITEDVNGTSFLGDINIARNAF